MMCSAKMHKETDRGARQALPSVVIRDLVPRAARRTIKRAWRELELSLCVAGLRRSQRPTDRLLLHLNHAWNNQGFSGDVSYLHAVASAAMASTGPILECGSGLTSLVVALLVGSKGIEVLSLEHMPEWRDTVARVFRRFSLPQTAIDAPLESYGEFDWYRLPSELPRDISLVICDGPPGDTRGGRYGLLPVCRHLLAPNCVILLDDADRVQEKRLLDRWREDFSVSYTLHESAAGAYASVTLPEGNAVSRVAASL
jgi:hypothetical protein